MLLLHFHLLLDCTPGLCKYLSCSIPLPACLPPAHLQQEPPVQQPSLHSLRAGSSGLRLLLWGCFPGTSGAPHLLQPCHPPGHASLGSQMHRARLREGGRRGSLPPPWCQLPSQLPPLRSRLASLEAAQAATWAVGTAVRLSCARLPFLLSRAERGEGEREGRQRHGLKVHARARHGGRGNHRQRGQVYIVPASALSSKLTSGRHRKIMSAISVILLWIFILHLAWPLSWWEVDASPSQAPCASQKMMT